MKSLWKMVMNNGVMLTAGLCIALVAGCGGDGDGGGTAITLTSITPDTGFNGADTSVTMTGSDFPGVPDEAYLEHTVLGRWDMTGVSFVDSTQIDATVPQGAAASTGETPDRYDVVLVFGGAVVTLSEAFQVTDEAPPGVTGVSPTSGWNGEKTKITVTGTGFIPLPSVFLSLAGIETELGSVVFVDETTLTAIVPAGLDEGLYTVIVENPSGLRGSLADAFLVSSAPAPKISSINPTSMDSATGGSLTIYGEDFDDEKDIADNYLIEAYMSDDQADLKKIALTVDSVAVDGTQMSVTVPVADQGTYVITVYNPDGQYDSYASLKMASSAEGKLGDAGPFVDSGKDLHFARRRHGAVIGSDDIENEYLYVAGGDSGTTYFRNVEYSPLSIFGNIGSWKLTRPLNVPRSGHALLEVKDASGVSWLYVVGGTSDGATPLGTVERSRVLTTDSAPLNLAASEGTSGTLTEGSWLYKVSAVMPDGEEFLASDSVGIYATTGEVLLTWDAVTGAAGYNVYRAEATNAGNEKRIAENVPQGTAGSEFFDDGLAAIEYTFSSTLSVAENAGAGTLAAGDWHYSVSSMTVNGEMKPCAEASVTVATDASVTLTWTESTSPDVLYYNVYRSENADDTSGERYLIARRVLGSPFADGGLPLILASGPDGLSAGATEVTGGSLAAGDYSYVVCAINEQGVSLPSPGATVTVTAPDNAVLLEWSSVEGALSYNVYRGATAGSEVLIRSGVRSTSMLDSGLAAGTDTPGDGRISPAPGTFSPLRLGTLARWEILPETLNTARVGLGGLTATRAGRTFLYALCGRDDGAVGLLNTVEKAEVTLAGGSLSAWAVESTTVPGAREFCGVARADAFNHPTIGEPSNYYLYAVQGAGSGIPKGLTSVEGSKASADDGTLTDWNLNSADEATRHYGNSATIGSGYLYIICGMDDSNNPSIDVKRGTLGSAGNVTLWADSSAKPATARAYQVVVVGSSYLYVIGGQTSAAATEPNVTVTGSVEQIPF